MTLLPSSGNSLSLCWHSFHSYVGFEVLSAVVMKSSTSIFWVITPCNLLKVNQFFFSEEFVGGLLLRSVGWLSTNLLTSTNYMALYPATQNFSFLVFKKSRARSQPLTIIFSKTKCSSKSVSIIIITTNPQRWEYTQLQTSNKGNCPAWDSCNSRSWIRHEGLKFLHYKINLRETKVY